MRYMLLIASNEEVARQRSQAELDAEFAAYTAFSKEVADRGVFLSGEVLHPVNAATTVRVRDGKVLTTDGPFAETKEQLSGFYVLKCKDLDEAIDFAAKMPGAQIGSIEIRPVMEWD
ncbi:hypothetical protein KDA_35990 [Dictyobacter alpinus]|uniref:YCII-related domain-containing protein n=1 Tax=Dictyobacter alpinus TaxID=2014873 RepID=A0A402B9T7_9CHLR|nr:YciI family protein [Dictyobacter alpinus]GCE28115.1 hypothetical protein KDA_35990 [Dictyobacter alpinus]